MTDPFNLSRFVEAQAESYATALAEVRRGRKQAHWMWYVFPQLLGLGTSDTAIRGPDEATAYLAHPVLGMRYRECVAALQDLDQTDPVVVFGTVDAQKLRSSLTLFCAIDPQPLCIAALDKWYGGHRDDRTLGLLARWGAGD